MLPRLDPHYQAMIAGLTRRMLAGLGDQILTRELQDGLTALERALAAAGCPEAAADLHTAQAQLHQSIGVLNSRSTRVPPP